MCVAGVGVASEEERKVAMVAFLVFLVGDQRPTVAENWEASDSIGDLGLLWEGRMVVGGWRARS
jgi:hypothetical protein